MNLKIKAKLPPKFKIIDHESAKRWYFDKAKWNTLEFAYKRTVIRSLCFWDISFFSQKITKRWTQGKKTKQKFGTPEFHKELWKICLQGDDVLIIVPRGFAKTTAVSKILTLWLLLFELEPSILIISSRGLGETIVGDIRRELEQNELIRHIWGVIVPTESRRDDKNEKWRQTELQLLNGTELKTLTKGQAVRGQRPTLLLIDDPEENKDVKNPIIADEFFNWIFTSLYNTLDEGGAMIVLGTIISTHCFVNRLKHESLERSFTVFEYAAIKNFDFKIWEQTKDWIKATANAVSLWPERWSIEKLHEKLNKIKEKPFFQEFMNIPFTLNGSPVFDDISKLKVIEPLEVKGDWQIFKDLKNQDGLIGVDMANGSLAGDWSVITVRNPQHELLAQYRAHISQDKLAEETNWIISQLRDCFVVPESNIGLAYIYKCKEFEWFSKVYRKKSMDKITMQESEVIGFNTNVKTKIYIITNLKSLIEKGLEVSPIEYEEIKNYYYDERGGMNAINPHHDDTIISDALSIEGIDHGLIAPMFMTF